MTSRETRKTRMWQGKRGRRGDRGERWTAGGGDWRPRVREKTKKRKEDKGTSKDKPISQELASSLCFWTTSTNKELIPSDSRETNYLGVERNVVFLSFCLSHFEKALFVVWNYLSSPQLSSLPFPPSFLLPIQCPPHPLSICQGKVYFAVIRDTRQWGSFLPILPLSRCLESRQLGSRPELWFAKRGPPAHLGPFSQVNRLL